MAISVTIKVLAVELNISVDRLIYQFSEIGICKTDLDCVTLQERDVLLAHMNCNQKKNNKKNVNISNKLTLQRKTLSTLSIFSSGGRTKKVQVEIRKKHTYVQSDSKILQEKDSDVLDSFDEFSDGVLSSSPSIQRHEANLSNDLNLIRKKNQNDNDNDNIIDQSSCTNKDGLFVLIDKKKIDMEDVSSNSKYNNQYKSEVRNKSYLSKKKKGNNLISGIMSSVHHNKNGGNTGNNNNRKISGNRRFRARQRLHSFRSRHSDKVNVNQYKKNTALNLVQYEYDELHSVVRSTKYRHHKPTILTHSFNKPTQVVIRNVVIGEMITISELANKMAVKSSQVIKMMMKLGTMVTINQVIDQQTAQLVTEEMGHRAILRRENDLEETVMNDRNFFDSSSLECRAPVVTVMGHVDHGKTSLLDYIRSSRIVDSEAGGITQHMGAYCVEVHSSDNNKKMITFLDTPGHEAFTAMRLRGIRITDIVVLVVAIDDGVMLQTTEAIQHVKQAKIPMIVALNKIDKSGSFDISRIKNDLAKEGVISEEWGGETQFINVSAKLGTGVENLLNAILLESELLELKAVRKTMASGVVIESFLDKGRGPVASVLVQEGTLRSGDVVLCGLEYGRVRSMRNELGDNISSAGPSMPVEIIGLSGPPFAGDFMLVVRDERKAREVALYRQGKFRAIKLERKKKDTLNTLVNDLSNENNAKLLFNVVLKTDVQGSVEAVSNVLNGLSNLDVRVNIIGSGVGRINETDVSLAIATRSVLLGFNVGSDILARKVIESGNVNVYYYSVIYDLIKDIKKLIESMLVVNDQNRKNIALMEVRDVFCVPRLGNIAGCMILEGVVHRHNKVRVLRKKSVVHEGELASLRRFKDDVNEVRAGMECGISIKNYTDIRSGDLIEVFD